MLRTRNVSNNTRAYVCTSLKGSAVAATYMGNWAPAPPAGAVSSTGQTIRKALALMPPLAPTPQIWNRYVAARTEHSTVDVDAVLQPPAHIPEAKLREWYYECNKANTELQAKVNELQEMVDRPSADGPAAEHRTQDCKVCQHTLWQATHDAPVTELQCRSAIGNSGGSSALRQLATKAHGKPHSRVALSNMAKQSTVTTTITISGYEVPRLDERSGLKCYCTTRCHRGRDPSSVWRYSLGCSATFRAIARVLRVGSERPITDDR